MEKHVPLLIPLERAAAGSRRKQRITQSHVGAGRQIGTHDLLDTGIQRKVLAFAGVVLDNHDTTLPLRCGGADIANMQRSATRY